MFEPRGVEATAFVTMPKLLDKAERATSSPQYVS